ncbi:MAG: hypothetical protein JO199_13780 [Candidatus Eremiobacteraeota bacterium]|nr:hypothetical protein [Candidatus Eremiobacteraeota bacterium]
MSEGLSLANNLLANNVQLNLDRNQRQLQNAVTQLSSGLRINNAADDPSGLAIATNLQTQVDGFNQAAENVQNANNAAQIALGALTTTTNILQRIRALAVEAASDVNSNDDRANLQTEISKLLLEINRISQNTSFNGQALLDGSHAGFQPEENAYFTITANAALAHSGGKLFGGNALANMTQAGAGAKTETAAMVGGQKYRISGTLNVTAGSAKELFLGKTLASGKTGPHHFSATVTGSGKGANTLALHVLAGKAKSLNVTFALLGSVVQSTGVNTGFLIACAVAANAQFNTTVGSSQGYSASGGPYATVDGSIEVQVVNTGTSIAVQETFINSATGQISVCPQLLSPLRASSNFENLQITLGDFGALDVGVTSYLKVSQNVAAATNPHNPAFNFQSGADEGDTIQVGIAATNTQTLRVSNLNVALSSGSNPSLGAQDAIGQVDIALENLLTEQARIGSVVVRLNYDLDNDNTAAVNIQAAESNIRDLNVGAATTEFTKLQILVQVGTSVLAQSNLNPQSVLELFR